MNYERSIAFHESLQATYETMAAGASDPQRKARYEDLAWGEYLAAQASRRDRDRVAAGIRPQDDEGLKARLAAGRNRLVHETPAS